MLVGGGAPTVLQKRGLSSCSPFLHLFIFASAGLKVLPGSLCSCEFEAWSRNLLGGNGEMLRSLDQSEVQSSAIAQTRGKQMIDEILYLLSLACIDPVPSSAHSGSSPHSSILPRTFPKVVLRGKEGRKWAGLQPEPSITTKRRRWEERRMGKGGGGGGGAKRDGRRRMER